jgi:hypothetical protein
MMEQVSMIELSRRPMSFQDVLRGSLTVASSVAKLLTTEGRYDLFQELIQQKVLPDDVYSQGIQARMENVIFEGTKGDYQTLFVISSILEKFFGPRECI